MGLFSKKPSSKIPEVSTNQYQGGANAYQQPHQQAPAAGFRGGSGFAGGPSSQQQQNYQGGGGGYQGYPAGGGGNAYANQYASGGPNAQQGSIFSKARPPAKGFGSAYDRMDGSSSSSRQENLARNLNGPSDAELEAEYGGGSRAYGGGYDGLEQKQEQEQEEDDEVEAIKQQIRFTKQESLSSTRNALRIAREAEETATNTMFKLGDQSEKIANTERHLDLAKGHASRAEDNAKEIVALNRSIFRPNLGMNKKSKRDAEEARIIQRHIDEREEREAVRRDALDAQKRLDQSMNGPGSGKSSFGRFGQDRFGSSSSSAAKKEEEARKNKLAQRSRYQFEADESDEEAENELDQNLDEIGELSSRLNMLGKAMGQEIDSQNVRLKRVGDKATTLDTKIFAGTQRLGNIK
ncbi:hypothetical protein IE53DRAFT_101962 [Violaceomyces palustris]|uniref:Uncharacterized protein n=1 Tax=Violaceomyces palustris TaxID=1673888 RepID=A0ACD0NX20_9BASI|nr:hypothetical protein IE53DRAFT_101962 [Violaceomyces palustris]